MKIKCPACAEINEITQKIVLDSSRSFNEEWARCSECKSYFITSGFDEAEEVTTNFAICNREEDGIRMNQYKNRLFRTTLEAANKYHPGFQSWLDIGCSYGGMLMLVKQQGINKAEGTEIVPEAIAYCATKGITAYRTFSVSTLPQTNKYDVISALDSNMFWTDQPDELLQIRELLNDNGMLIMKVVDRSWIVSIGIMLRGIAPSFGKKLMKAGVFNHRFSMPVKSMLHLLKKQGFEILHTSINDALPSDEARPALKIWHKISSLLFTVSHIYAGPTLMIVARKQNAS